MGFCFSGTHWRDGQTTPVEMETLGARASRGFEERWGKKGESKRKKVEFQREAGLSNGLRVGGDCGGGTVS